MAPASRGLLYQVALAERGEDHHRGAPAAGAIRRAASRPSRPGILMSRMGDVGTVLGHQPDRLVAPAPCRPPRRNPLLAQGLDQVEADDGPRPRPPQPERRRAPLTTR